MALVVFLPLRDLRMGAQILILQTLDGGDKGCRMHAEACERRPGGIRGGGITLEDADLLCGSRNDEVWGIF